MSRGRCNICKAARKVHVDGLIPGKPSGNSSQVLLRRSNKRMPRSSIRPMSAEAS
jgi:hypothetical protein